MSAATLGLRGVALFDQVPAERLEAIAAAAEEMRLEPGEALFEQGTHGTHFFVLLEGVLSDVKEDTARRIVVNRHHGSIDMESRPGDTRVRVRLPVHPVVDPKGTA